MSIYTLYTGLDGGKGLAIILIVEDEAPILVLTQSILQDAGYEILTAASLAEAESIINSDQAIGAVFTDVNLGPDHEGGLRVGQITAQARPQTPVIYTSGRGLTDGMKSLFVERSTFLPKPYTSEQLVETISGLVRSRGG
jgi:DNA-binding NtrC family response regulator